MHIIITLKTLPADQDVEVGDSGIDGPAPVQV